MSFYDPTSGLPRRSGQPGYRAVEQELRLIGGPPAFRQGSTNSGVGGFGISPVSPRLGIDATRPDFQGILNSDPLLAQFRNELGAQSVADRSSLALARRRALAQFGLIPEGLGQNPLVGGQEALTDIDAETRALAERNTQEGLSTVGRLNREFARVEQNIADSLAARGGLRSGAYGIALKDLQQQRKTAEFDATAQVMDHLAMLLRGYIDAERQYAQQLAAAQRDAAGRIDPATLAGTPAESALHVGFSSDGRPVYRGEQTGRLFLDDRSSYSGQVFAQPPGAPAPPRPAPTPTGTFLGQDEVYQAGRNRLA